MFAIVYGDECYHPEHRMNRTDCYEARRKCFDYIRDKFGIVSSEEPVDWAVRSLHLVHHAMWGVDGERNTFAQPVPLFNLVYHDALVYQLQYDMTQIERGFVEFVQQRYQK